MKRAALYVRVSTAEQRDKGLSVDNQIEALQAYCEANGYQVVGLYNDAGISARKRYTKRPELLRLCEDCKAGRVDIILFTKLDRWFRSVADYYQVQTILDQARVPWRAIWEDYETETSAGCFKVNIMLSVAQAESDRTSERIKAVNAYKRSKGEYLGKAPTGYMKQDKVLVKNPEQEAAVNAMFQTYFDTGSLAEATRAIQHEGVMIGRDCVYKMLRSRAYIGDASGTKCEPYITVEQHNRIVSDIKRRRTRRTKDDDNVYLFVGMMFCKECGHPISSTSVIRPTKSGEKARYSYYRCHKRTTCQCNNNHTVSERKLEKYLLDNVMTELDNYRANVLKTKSPIKDAQKEIRRIQAKIERIGDRYENGEISHARYKEKVDTLREQIVSIQSSMGSADVQIDIPDNWRDIYNDLDMNHKKTFWHRIIRRIDLTNLEDISITF